MEQRRLTRGFALRRMPGEVVSRSCYRGPVAPYGGADIGEVTSTASRIPDGDKTAWYSEWRALAERVHANADRSAATGHRISTRESHLRASNYYRLCEFYLRVDSSNDPEVREVGQLSVDSFAEAAQLRNPAAEQVRFPYEDTTLPGWWILADLGTAHPTGGDPAGPRPTLLLHGGFDSTEEELYFSGGAAAARRGYHVPAFLVPDKAAPFVTRSCSSVRTGKPSSPLPSTGSSSARM